MKNKTLLLSCLAVTAMTTLAACDSSTSSTSTPANSQITGIVRTNASGPAPLANAIIQIETPDGKLVKEITSNASGKFTANVAPGTYVIDPKNVINSDSFVPPAKSTVTLVANQNLQETLNYWKPLL